MMPDPTPAAAVLRVGLLAILLFAGACATSPSASEDSPATSADAPRGESEALMMARNALNAGDCRAAAEHHLAAARFSSDKDVAASASQLALLCQNLDSARAAIDRWHELDPYSGEAALAGAIVAMKRYDVEAARQALTGWRDSGSGGTQDPLSFIQALQPEVDAPLLHRLFTEVLVEDDPSVEVVLAQARLAMSAQNMDAAIEAAERASMLDSSMIEPQVIVMRALSVLGEHNAALAGARALPAEALQGEQAFLIADLLAAADRSRDAADELERLAASPETRGGAQLRQVTAAMRNGQLDEVERLLRDMVSREGSGNQALAMLYYGQLAERRGDHALAVRSYSMLAQTPLGLTARTAAARVMMRQGARDDALKLLDDYIEQNLREALPVGLARVHLMAENDDLKGALAHLSGLAKQYPNHPDIDYTRATVLETGGRTRDSIAEFERALKRRPEDPQLLNALGYTLADHRQRLREAEDYVRKALEASPDSPAIQDSLGWVLYRRGRTDEAVSVLERAWENSGDAEIGSHFGEVLWESGEQSRARYVWEQALNGEPDHERLRATMKRLTGEDEGS